MSTKWAGGKGDSPRGNINSACVRPCANRDLMDDSTGYEYDFCNECVRINGVDTEFKPLGEGK